MGGFLFRFTIIFLVLFAVFSSKPLEEPHLELRQQFDTIIDPIAFQLDNPSANFVDSGSEKEAKDILQHKMPKTLFDFTDAVKGLVSTIGAAILALITGKIFPFFKESAKHL